MFFDTNIASLKHQCGGFMKSVGQEPIDGHQICIVTLWLHVGEV